MQKLVQFVSFVAFISFSTVNCESCGSIDAEEVNLVLFKDGMYSFSLNNINEILMDIKFDSEKATVIYTFDFLENIDSVSVQKIASSYLFKNESYNFLVLDYGKFSGENYIFDAVPNAIKIGKLFGKTLVELFNTNRIDINKIILIGYSLGAHLMGEVGRTVQEVSRNTLKIPKIIGLDPAGPAFYPLNPYVVALNKQDADFVQIIHTDVENFGIPISTGHADFWPNGGQTQPNCPEFDNTNIFKPENLCSHFRSIEYFAESVLMNYGFPSIECDSWLNFQENNCTGHKANDLNYLGPKADPQLYGNFFLVTNGMPNYSKGLNGIYNFHL